MSYETSKSYIGGGALSDVVVKFSRLMGTLCNMQDVLFINLSFVPVLPSWLGGSCCRSAVYMSPSKPRRLARCSGGSWAVRKEPFWGTRGPRESRGESPGCPRTATPDEEIVNASFSFIILLLNVFMDTKDIFAQYKNPQSSYDQTVYTVIKRIQQSILF